MYWLNGNKVTQNLLKNILVLKSDFYWSTLGTDFLSLFGDQSGKLSFQIEHGLPMKYFWGEE